MLNGIEYEKWTELCAAILNWAELKCLPFIYFTCCLGCFSTFFLLYFTFFFFFLISVFYFLEQHRLSSTKATNWICQFSKSMIEPTRNENNIKELNNKQSRKQEAESKNCSKIVNSFLLCHHLNIGKYLSEKSCMANKVAQQRIRRP